MDKAIASTGDEAVVRAAMFYVLNDSLLINSVPGNQAEGSDGAEGSMQEPRSWSPKCGIQVIRAACCTTI